MSFLRNKTLIVTGASMGAGRALALELAEHGVNLVLNARTREPLDAVCEQCLEKGVQAACVAGDASRADVADELLAAARGMPAFYGFIHVAGVMHPGPYIWELDEAQFDETFAASVKAAWQLIRVATPALRENGGGIAVFYGSGAAEISQPGLAAYCAAKAAEEHLVRQLAAEEPEVVSFVFRPGIVETRMQAMARNATGGAAEYLHRVFRPWKDHGELLTPEDAARGLMRALASMPRRFHGRVVSVRDV